MQIRSSMAADGAPIDGAVGDAAATTLILDVNGDGSVIKEVLAPGSGACPEAGFTVGLNYVGTVQATGAEFDRNHGGYPFSFKLGAGSVIQGWEDGVLHMRIGEKARLTIAPEKGYGDEGSEPDVPPGATLCFDVELVSIEENRVDKAAERQRLADLQAERAAIGDERAEKKKKRDAAKKAAAERGEASKKGGKKKEATTALDLDPKDIKKLKPAQMKDQLKARGLSTQGNKKELLARLLEACKISD